MGIEWLSVTEVDGTESLISVSDIVAIKEGGQGDRISTEVFLRHKAVLVVVESLERIREKLSFSKCGVDGCSFRGGICDACGRENKRLGALTNTEALMFILGWQGGTIHQLSRELGVETTEILFANNEKMNELARLAQQKRRVVNEQR